MLKHRYTTDFFVPFDWYLAVLGAVHPCDFLPDNTEGHTVAPPFTHQLVSPPGTFRCQEGLQLRR